MYIHVDLAGVQPEVTMHDHDDLTRFHVQVTAPDPTYIDRDRLIELSGREHDAAWLRRLDAMISYADAQGWVSDRGIRAHLVIHPTPPDAPDRSAAS